MGVGSKVGVGGKGVAVAVGAGWVGAGVAVGSGVGVKRTTVAGGASWVRLMCAKVGMAACTVVATGVVGAGVALGWNVELTGVGLAVVGRRATATRSVGVLTGVVGRLSIGGSLKSAISMANASSDRSAMPTQRPNWRRVLTPGLKIVGRPAA